MSDIKMGDVFELPVKHVCYENEDDCVDQCIDGSGRQVFESFFDDVGYVSEAVNAINNHDRLTAENEALREEVERLRVKHDLLLAKIEAIQLRDCQRDAEVIERMAKPIATEFFYWWYNRPGSNTGQGFDEWWQLRQQAKD